MIRIPRIVKTGTGLCSAKLGIQTEGSLRFGLGVSQTQATIHKVYNGVIGEVSAPRCHRFRVCSNQPPYFLSRTRIDGMISLGGLNYRAFEQLDFDVLVSSIQEQLQPT